jgi:hypothetical protein
LGAGPRITSGPAAFALHDEDPRGTNPILRKLAHAIIANQRFEIALLDDVRRRVQTEPEAVADLGLTRIVRREIGGLEHQWQFVKRRPPGFWTWRSRRAWRRRIAT